MTWLQDYTPNLPWQLVSMNWENFHMSTWPYFWRKFLQIILVNVKSVESPEPAWKMQNTLIFDCSNLRVRLTYAWWEEGEEILCSIQLLQCRHPAQISRQFFYLIVVQLEGDAVDERFKRLRYLLKIVKLLTQALKNAQPWEQLGSIVIFRILKTKERH